MLFIRCQKFKELLLWLRVSHGSDCGCWCQMKTDGRGFCQGLGPAPGSCPWCERFHLLVDVWQTDSSRPWIKMVWAGRLWEQSPVSGWPCCSARHEMHYLLLLLRASQFGSCCYGQKKLLCGRDVRQNSKLDPNVFITTVIIWSSVF